MAFQTLKHRKSHIENTNSLNIDIYEKAVIINFTCIIAHASNG